MIKFLDTLYLGSAEPEGGGTTPTGEISITANGNYNVTEYASAEVNVSGGTDTYSAVITLAGVVEGLPQDSEEDDVAAANLILAEI